MRRALLPHFANGVLLESLPLDGGGWEGVNQPTQGAREDPNTGCR